MVRKILMVLVGIGFLAGLCFFLFPYVNSWMVNNDAKKEIESFEVLKEEKNFDTHDTITSYIKMGKTVLVMLGLLIKRIL